MYSSLRIVSVIEETLIASPVLGERWEDFNIIFDNKKNECAK